MLWRRLIYAILALASIVAFVLTDSNVAMFIMICLVAFPIASYVMLLIAAKRVKFDCEMRDSCIRGGALQITMKAGLRPRFLAGYVKVITDIENTTFSKTERKTFEFQDLTYEPRIYEYKSADSGRISVNFKTIRIIDIFGVCAVNVKCNRYLEAIVSPLLFEDIQARVGVKSRDSYSGETPLPQRGNDHTEIFDIRDYVEGDALNSVHWKLSGKFDSLKCKEYGSSDEHKTLVLVDMSRRKGQNTATDAQLNAVLDTAISVSDALKADKYAHNVGYFNDGVFVSTEVTDNSSFVSMVFDLMSVKVNDNNAETLFYLSCSVECVSFTKIILITTFVDPDEIKNHADFDITAIAICDNLAELAEDSLKIINVTVDQIETALTAVEL